jgi:hypothetical protein
MAFLGFTDFSANKLMWTPPSRVKEAEKQNLSVTQAKKIRHENGPEGDLMGTASEF